MNINKLLIQVPTTEAAAKEYIETCVLEIGGGFHPDDSMTEMVNISTDKPIFKKCDALVIDRNIDACFKLLGEKVYTVGLRAMNKLKG